jgi:hypothetical protein
MRTTQTWRTYPANTMMPMKSCACPYDEWIIMPTTYHGPTSQTSRGNTRVQLCCQMPTACLSVDSGCWPQSWVTSSP